MGNVTSTEFTSTQADVGSSQRAVVTVLPVRVSRRVSAVDPGRSSKWSAAKMAAVSMSFSMATPDGVIPPTNVRPERT